MQNIVASIEREGKIYYKEHPPQLKNQTFISDSICYNACVMAEQAGARGIISMTNSGYTAFKLSSHRPKANIFIFTENRSLLNTLSLVWGVRGFFYDKYESTDETIGDIKNFLKKESDGSLLDQFAAPIPAWKFLSLFTLPVVNVILYVIALSLNLQWQTNWILYLITTPLGFRPMAIDSASSMARPAGSRTC